MGWVLLTWVLVCLAFFVGYVFGFRVGWYRAFRHDSEDQ